MGKRQNNEELFRSMPVAQAILTLAVPTVVSQIITIIYNMADTFFIGQLGDPKQVGSGNAGDAAVYVYDSAFQSVWRRWGKPDLALFGQGRTGKGIALRCILYLDSRCGFCFVWPDGSGWKTGTFAGSWSQ